MYTLLQENKWKELYARKMYIRIQPFIYHRSYLYMMTIMKVFLDVNAVVYLCICL